MGRIVDKKLLDSLRKKPCEACGSKLDITVHHIKSVRSGGHDTEDNILTLCMRCHMSVHSIGLTRFVDRYPHLAKTLESKMFYFCKDRKKWCKDLVQ